MVCCNSRAACSTINMPLLHSPYDSAYNLHKSCKKASYIYAHIAISFGHTRVQILACETQASHVKVYCAPSAHLTSAASEDSRASTAFHGMDMIGSMACLCCRFWNVWSHI